MTTRLLSIHILLLDLFFTTGLVLLLAIGNGNLGKVNSIEEIEEGLE